MNNKTKMRRGVTIEKRVNGKKVSYWIVDENGIGIEGFKLKYQAVEKLFFGQ